MFFPDVWNEIKRHPSHVELKVKGHPNKKYHEKERPMWMEDLSRKPSGKVILVGGHSKSFIELVDKYATNKQITGYEVYAKDKLFNTELVYVKMEFKGQKMQISEVTNVYRPAMNLRTGSEQTKWWT